MSDTFPLLLKEGKTFPMPFLLSSIKNLQLEEIIELSPSPGKGIYGEAKEG